MMTKSNPYKDSAEKTVRDIRRRTRRHYLAEDKIRIVLEGLRGEDSIAELCRREGTNSNVYFRWSRKFLEAGKERLAGGPSTGYDVIKFNSFGLQIQSSRYSLMMASVTSGPIPSPPSASNFSDIFSPFVSRMDSFVSFDS